MGYETGPFGIGGNVRGAAAFVFRGRLGPPFLAFVAARAARLDLVVAAAGDDVVEAEVRGALPLIDAFEMACSLGPIACLVESWERVELEP